MKRRSGLVSNSSSSSFTCDVCKRTESGWDLGLEDAGMFECRNSHVICGSHKLKLTNEAAKKYIQIAIDDGFLNESDTASAVERLATGRVNAAWITNSNLEETIFGEMIPEETCPICQMKVIMDTDMFRYLKSKLNKPQLEIENEIKSKYETYSKLKEHLYG